MVQGASKMITTISATSCAVMLVGAFFFEDKLGFLAGVLIGGLTSIFKVWLMSESIIKSVAMEPSSAKNYATLQYYLRYLVTGTALVACALIPFINIWGAIIGMFTFSIAAYMSRLTAKK